MVFVRIVFKPRPNKPKLGLAYLDSELKIGLKYPTGQVREGTENLFNNSKLIYIGWTSSDGEVLFS